MRLIISQLEPYDYVKPTSELDWKHRLNFMQKAIFNGRVIDLKDANINITDKGYFFDFAVYSTVKVIQGKAFFLEYHVERLLESAKLINLGNGLKKSELMRWTNTLISKNQIRDALLRFVLIGDADENKKAKLYIFPVSGLTYYPRKYFRKGIKAITFSGERRLPKAKTKDLLMSFLALEHAKKKGAQEALLVDREGNIREGTRSNFFAIRGNTIIAPPSQKVLGGITKKILCKATAGHFQMEQQDIPLKKIKNFDEFFLSSTLLNVMPIRQIDGHEIKGEFMRTRLIQKLYKKFYDKKILKS